MNSYRVKLNFKSHKRQQNGELKYFFRCPLSNKVQFGHFEDYKKPGGKHSSVFGMTYVFVDKTYQKGSDFKALLLLKPNVYSIYF